MIIATTTDHDTDEDTEAASRVTRSVIDNFMRRPSIEDQAMRVILTMANNDLNMMKTGAEESILCDAAFIFMNRNRVRFLISGRSFALHFENGKLVHRSDAREASVIGYGPRFEPRLEEAFELHQEKNAFLAASGALHESLSDEEIEAALNRSETPEEWMEQLKTMAGDDRQFCAVTSFLPVAKPFRLRSLFVRV